MRKAGLLLLTLALAACGGVAMQPFYRTDQLTFDSTLLGAWGDTSTREGVVLTWDDDAYDIRYTDSDGRQAAFTGRLFRWSGRTALDVTPARLPDSVGRAMPDVYWSLMVPGHTVFWLDHTTDRLAFAGLDPDTLKAYLRRHPLAVAHTYRDSTLVLLAPTAQLQAFVAAFRQSHKLGDSTVWRRRR